MVIHYLILLFMFGLIDLCKKANEKQESGMEEVNIKTVLEFEKLKTGRTIAIKEIDVILRKVTIKNRFVFL